ncbi:hypothetical protein JOB18_036447 [Solea senegalensis]|uniref:Uncharacterized protein n=1 Tax=Solea senegalensis TaxID=28829 RepID=A0AAV6R929_SOLSE|nr:hypothetical protein JOB18_036447 [Solea senegalensis]
MANVIDLLGSASLIVNRNPSMSRPYMLYQLFNLASSILSPSTVVLMIAGSFTVLLNITPNAALVLAVIPPAIFLGISFKIKSDTQIKIAAVLSTFYGFLMMISALVLIATMMAEKTIMTPSSLFIIALACFYLLTAIMHPQEVGLVVYGLLYILCIPSAYLLLAIYSMVNMNNVSWGTRETVAPPGPGAPVAAPPLTTAQKMKNKLTEIFTQSNCCRKVWRGCRGEEVVVSRQNSMIFQEEQYGPQPQNTIVVDERIPEIPQVEQSRVEEPPAVVCPNQCWVSQLQSLSEDMQLREGQLHQDEEHFFRELTSKYLEPLPDDKKKQKLMAEKLKALRNKMTFAYFMCNAVWLVMTFTLQLADANIAIQVPKLDTNMEFTGQYMYIDPLGFMFIFSFAFVVLIQFLSMLWHRVSTLIHYVAYLDTESKIKKEQQPTKEVKDDDNDDDNDDNNDDNNDDSDDDSDEDSDEDSDHFLFPNLLNRSHDHGSLV